MRRRKAKRKLGHIKTKVCLRVTCEWWTDAAKSARLVHRHGSPEIAGAPRVYSMRAPDIYRPGAPVWPGSEITHAFFVFHMGGFVFRNDRREPLKVGRILRLWGGPPLVSSTVSSSRRSRESVANEGPTYAKNRHVASFQRSLYDYGDQLLLERDWWLIST